MAKNISTFSTIICAAVFSLTGYAFAGPTHSGDSTVTHLAFEDSARDYQVNIRAQLVDSVAITNLTNAPTHYDDAMSIRLFLDGHFTQARHFDARVNVNTDYTNRDIADHFRLPSPASMAGGSSSKKSSAQKGVLARSLAGQRRRRGAHRGASSPSIAAPGL